MTDGGDTSTVSEVDLRDAQAIRLAFAALEGSSNPRSGTTNSVRRWILNGVWFVPRGAYVHPHWSIAAQANPARANITYEHVVPISRVREELLSGPQTDEAYAKAMATLLVMAVITKEEDRRLRQSGLANKHPQDIITDVWARYRVAQIEMTETPGPTLDTEHDLPAAPESLFRDEGNEATTEATSAEDMVATWIGDSTVPTTAIETTSFSQEESYKNGLRNAREAKAYSRIGISVALGISAIAWWKLENEEPIGTERHQRSMAQVAGLPVSSEVDSLNYSGHRCPSCGAQPGEPCRTTDNRSTPKPHNHRLLGGFVTP